jgi:hypothetical protein
MTPYRRGGPKAQKINRLMVLVNGIEKESESEKKNHANENPAIPPVEATLSGSFLIIAKMTLFVSPFWPALSLHNNRRLK